MRRRERLIAILMSAAMAITTFVVPVEAVASPVYENQVINSMEHRVNDDDDAFSGKVEDISWGTDDDGSYYLHVKGWAVNNDDRTSTVPVVVYVGWPGQSDGYEYTLSADQAFDGESGIGAGHGFELKTVLPKAVSGKWMIFVYAEDNEDHWNDTELGETELNIGNTLCIDNENVWLTKKGNFSYVKALGTKDTDTVTWSLDGNAKKCVKVETSDNGRTAKVIARKNGTGTLTCHVGDKLFKCSITVRIPKTFNVKLKVGKSKDLTNKIEKTLGLRGKRYSLKERSDDHMNEGSAAEHNIMDFVITGKKKGKTTIRMTVGKTDVVINVKVV